MNESKQRMAGGAHAPVPQAENEARPDTQTHMHAMSCAHATSTYRAHAPHVMSCHVHTPCTHTTRTHQPRVWSTPAMKSAGNAFSNRSCTRASPRGTRTTRHTATHATHSHPRAREQRQNERIICEARPRSERASVCVCVCVRARARACVCVRVFVCEREREYG